MSPSQVLEQVTFAVPCMEIKDTGGQNTTNQEIDGATFAKFAFAATADMVISRWIDVAGDSCRSWQGRFREVKGVGMRLCEDAGRSRAGPTCNANIHSNEI